MKSIKSIFKRFLIIAGGFLLVFIAILAITYTVLNIKWGGELRDEIEKIKLAGEPSKLEEIIPPPLPPSQNAAFELQQIFSEMTDGTFSMSDAGKTNKDIVELIDLCWNPSSDNDFSAELTKNQEKIKNILGKEHFRKIFELCNQVALKPGMNFNHDYNQGPALLLPHLQSFRDISRLLIIKAQLELLDGQRDKAWDTILVAFKISSFLRDEPIIISQLVRIYCDRMLFEFLESNLPAYGISNDHAKKLIVVLVTARSLHPSCMKKAIDVERLSFAKLYEHILSGKIDIFSLYGDVRINNIFFIGFLRSPFIKNFMKKDYAEYIKRTQENKRDYDLPYSKSMESISNARESDIPAYCILTKLLYINLGSLRTKVAMAQTLADENRIRLALEMYKNNNGKYPDELEMLSPEYLKEIPLSEMTAQPFEYSKYKVPYRYSYSLNCYTSEELRISQIRSALEQYKDINGSYPEKLDLLSPQFLKEIPVSVITGKPFEYSKEKPTFGEKYKLSPKLLKPSFHYSEVKLPTDRIRSAIEQYKELHGSYPEKIDQLAPECLEGIPLSEIDYSPHETPYKISGGIPETKFRPKK